MQRICCKIYSNGNRGGHLLNGESIPYNPNPIFLGVSFDERLQFENLNTRPPSRLNIIEIFFHSSCYLTKKLWPKFTASLLGLFLIILSFQSLVSPIKFQIELFCACLDLNETVPAYELYPTDGIGKMYFVKHGQAFNFPKTTME